MAVGQGKFCNFEDCPGRRRSDSTSYWTTQLPDGVKRSGLHYACKELLKRKAWHEHMAQTKKAEYAVVCNDPRGHMEDWSVIRKFEGTEHWELFQERVSSMQKAYEIVTAMNLLEMQKAGVIS